MPTASSDSAKTEKVVSYVGTADERKISAADWKSVGAEGQAAVVWNERNRRQIPASEFSKEALAYLETDSGFKVSEA